MILPEPARGELVHWRSSSRGGADDGEPIPASPSGSLGELSVGQDDGVLPRQLGMTYFEDLSPYSYSVRAAQAGSTRNVGWLDSVHPFASSPPSRGFLDRLWSYCRIIVNPLRGLHVCELCSEPASTFVRDGTRLLLGSGEIRVFSPTGEAFAAPNLIYHYVCDHDYCPPTAFVRAVQDGPSPSSDTYVRLLESTDLTWRENESRAEEPACFRFVRTETGEIVREEVKRR